MGVEYHHGTRVRSIALEERKIASIDVSHPETGAGTVTGDYFILATPVERAAPLLNQAIVEADQTLGLRQDAGR